MSSAPHTLAVTTPLSSDAWPQRAIARLVGSRLFWALFLAAGFTLPLVRSILRPLPVPPPIVGSFPAFSAVDESGRPLTNATLAGRIVILEFASVDAVRAGSPFARLQTRVRNTGNAVHLVTFLRGDTDPGSLAELARQSHAGTWRWSFAVEPFVGSTSDASPRPAGGVNALEAAAAAAARETSLDGKLVLLDTRGRIRRVAPPTKENLDAMMRDIGLLANLPDQLPEERRSR